MKAIGKFIAVTPIEEEVKIEAGITLIQEEVDMFRYKRGKVVSPGTDVHGIKEDDEIYYDKSHSFTMVVKGRQLTFLQERDVVLVS